MTGAPFQVGSRHRLHVLNQDTMKLREIVGAESLRRRLGVAPDDNGGISYFHTRTLCPARLY